MVCQSLFPGVGYRGMVKEEAYFGEGTGPIVNAECRWTTPWRTDVACLASWYPNCEHYEDVGIVCWGPSGE